MAYTCAVCERELDPPEEGIELLFADGGEAIERQCGYLFQSPRVCVCGISCLYIYVEGMVDDWFRHNG